MAIALSWHNRRTLTKSYTPAFCAAIALWTTACAGTQQRPTLAIEHVTVVDVVDGRLSPDQTVLISGRRIQSVSASGEVRVTGGTELLDGRGRYLIPGLWDMHVHVDLADLPILVAFGITGVRDMGGDFREVSSWRSRINRGSLLGPRIVAGGPRLVGPPKTNGAADRVVSNAADGVRAVDSLAALGVDFIKIHEGIPRDAYFAIAHEARARHLDFVGHVPESISPIEASDAGQKSIEHLEFLPDRCLQLFDANVIAGTTPVTTECNAQNIDRLLTQLAANKTWLDPTISMFRVYVSPAAYQAILTGFGKLVPAIRGKRIRILAGTDMSSPRMKPGRSLHDELALLVAAGFTPAEVLRAATSNAAEFVGMSDSVGLVRRGMLADLVLLAGDPLLDIHNTQRIVAVIQNGRVVPTMVRIRAGSSP